MGIVKCPFPSRRENRESFLACQEKSLVCQEPGIQTLIAMNSALLTAKSACFRSRIPVSFGK